jgi:hypothetical protein
MKEVTMRRVILLVAVWLVAAVYLTSTGIHAQAPAANTSSTNGFLGSIQNCEHQVSIWRLEERLAMVFAVLLIVSGIVISTLHRSQGKWARLAILVLGAGSTILTAINTRVLDADYRTLERTISDGDASIRQLDALAQIMQGVPPSTKDWEDAKDAFLKELAQFQVISNGLTGTTSNPRAQNSEGVLPRVYAQSTLPAWVVKPPQDSASMYFVGSAADTNLTNAKQNSLDDAYHSAVLALRSKAPMASDGALLALVKASAVVRDSAVAYDGGKGNYIGYTLLLLSSQVESFGVSSLPSGNSAQSPPTKFEKAGWQPADLTINPTSGLFALDASGGVSRLTADPKATPRIENLFRVEASYSGTALAASSESVFVAANARLGCTVYRYSLATKTVSKRLLAVHENCFGVATDGNTLYVTLPDRKEIRYWDSWDAPSAKIWSLAGIGKPGCLVFDVSGRRLIVTDDSGKAYAVSIPGGKTQLLTSDLGYVQSISASQFQIIAASGTKLLFIDRFENRGEDPPAGLRSLTGGHIVGVAVGALDELWFADYDKKLVEGPFPLS